MLKKYKKKQNNNNNNMNVYLLFIQRTLQYLQYIVHCLSDFFFSLFFFYCFFL